MVARRIDPIPDPVAETSATIYINLWIDRQVERYTDLLMTIAHVPRPVRGGPGAVS